MNRVSFIWALAALLAAGCNAAVTPDQPDAAQDVGAARYLEDLRL